MESNTRMNYVFVDYENVQALDLNAIAGKPVKVFLVIGARQKTLPTSLTGQIHKYHAQVQLIESEGTSKNALDMVLACHVGAESKSDPEGYFHVVARDKDYDALIKHLRTMGIRACRDEEFSKVSALVQVGRLSPEERVKWVAARLSKNKASRPTRKKSLVASIHAICRKELSEEEVGRIAERMVSLKLIAISPQGLVTYAH